MGEIYEVTHGISLFLKQFYERLTIFITANLP